MIMCLHWGIGLIPSPGVYSVAIPMGKGFTVQLLKKKVILPKIITRLAIAVAAMTKLTKILNSSVISTRMNEMDTYNARY